MKDKLNEFLEVFISLFIFLLIPLLIVYSFLTLYDFLSESYTYKNVYEYEDLDGNIGISDNCTYNKDYGYFSQSDNQVCYIDGVKTLVKTIKIYGTKKCYILDGVCEEKIYIKLHFSLIPLLFLPIVLLIAFLTKDYGSLSFPLLWIGFNFIFLVGIDNIKNK